MSPPRGRGWETRVLGWLEWPANIGLTNLLWFALSLPLVTWLSAAVAITAALDRWRQTGDTRVVTNALQAWRNTWRATLGLSVASALVLGLLALNAVFLATRTGPAALVLLGGTVALLFAWVALHLTLVPLIALFPELSWRAWVRAAFVMAFQHPLVTVANVALTGLLGVGLALLPTLVPFASAAVVAVVALGTVQRHLAVVDDAE